MMLRYDALVMLTHHSLLDHELSSTTIGRGGGFPEEVDISSPRRSPSAEFVVSFLRQKFKLPTKIEPLKFAPYTFPLVFSIVIRVFSKPCFAQLANWAAST
jgi:hypothetical protein